MYKIDGMPHFARVYGQDLAADQDLPVNATANGNGGFVDLASTEGSIEVIARVGADGMVLANAKTLTIKLQHKAATDADGAATDLATIYTLTAAGGNGTKAKGTELARYVIPTNAKRQVRVVFTTDDAAADGTLDVIPTYLPR